jgi:hypothetical protein
MSLFMDFVESVASGVVSAVSERSSVSSAGDAVRTCCEQLGWSIDERLNANEVCLHFNDPLVGIRKVLVGIGDHGTIVGFTVFSAVNIPSQQVPAAALGHLLQRNSKLFVAWQMCIRDGGDVAFALNYCALAVGLQPGVFKMLCETMVKEAHEFDVKMREAGLL